MSELYELPDGWEWTKLKNVCNLLNGYAFKATDYVEKSDTVLIRMGNIRPNGSFDANHKIQYLPNKFVNELPNFILKEGDLIIAMTDLATEMRILGNPTLVTNLNSRTFMLNQRVGKLCNFDFSKVTIEYLRYIITAPQIKEYYKSLGGGGLQINIGKQQILSVDFPLPPLTEQQRIVSKLDLLFEKIDRSIALHQKNMDEANAFMGSVLNDVFGELEGNYEKRTLESFNKKMSSGGTPSRKEMKYWNGTIEWFSSGELNQLYTLPSKEKITQIGLDNTSAKLFPKGTLLIGMYDTAAMKMSILSNDGSCNQAIVGFKPKEDELNIYFAKYQLEYLKKEILEQRQGVRQQNLNLSKIKNVEIEYPPLSIQQKVVTYLDEISKKIEKIKQLQKEKMASLKALKASILDSAFRGEL